MAGIPTDPWSLARERYLETLTEEEKIMFTHASLENVLYTASAAQNRQQEASKSMALVKRLKPFIDTISEYGAALDVFSNTSPTIMCPLWGSIRVLLHAASEFHNYFEKLIDMLVTIGDILPTFRVYEKIFASHRFLLHALSVVYLDIITFCMNAKRVFNKLREKKGLHAIQFKILWKPFNRQFGEVIENFRRHKENVESQASLSHMIEAANERGAQLDERSQAQLQRAKENALQRERMRSQILKKLSNIDHESRHRELRKKRFEDTGNWIFSTKQFTEWIAKEKSCCLWCHGIPGSGKSIITTAVVDALLTSKFVVTPVVVYFYCDYSNHSTLRAPNILENFIMQLLSKTAIPNAIESKLATAYNGIRKPCADELLEILFIVLKRFDYAQVFFVLDGIDECGGSDRSDLLAAIQSILRPGPTTVKFFLASRADVDLKRAFESHICLPISTHDVTADIESFVNGIVQAKIESRELVVMDPLLVKEIIDALVNGAQGMFIWVTFQIDDICEEICDDGIRRVLRSLPVGLVATYTRALQKIHGKKPATAQLARKIFKWMICSRRPLIMDEIKEAISISPLDRSLDPGKLTTDDSKIIQACANLAVIDSDEETIRFAHYSVQEFLLSGPVDESIIDIHFQLSDAEREVGEICVTYLSFSRFETQLVKTHDTVNTSLSALGSPLLLRESSLGWLGKIVFDGWARFRGASTNKPIHTINWLEYLKNTRPVPPSQQIQQQYRLLNYVIENWAWHTIGFSDTNTKLWPSFRALALDRNLPFSFRPWGLVNTLPDLPYMSMVLWAIDAGHDPLLRLLVNPPKGSGLRGYLFQEIEEDELPLAIVALHRSAYNGHDAMVKLLLECGADVNATNRDAETALHMAAKGGHSTVAKVLLDSGALLSAVDSYGNFPIYLAAQYGHDKVVKVLMQGDGDSGLFITDVHNGLNTPLHIAAQNGHEAVVKLLLENFTRMQDMTNIDAETPLHLAARLGHEAVVKLLLNNGAYQNATNKSGQTILHLAAKGGHIAVVELLLESGADWDRTNIASNTPLHLAALGGHDAVVKLLLDYGKDRGKGHERKQQHAMNKALSLAARCGHDTTVKLLLGYGADQNTIDSEAETVLHLASKGGHDSVVKLLLAGGADPNAVGGNAETALHLAAQGGYEAVVKLLLHYGAHTDMGTSTTQKTALHLAAQGGYDTVVKLLLEHGANQYATNTNAETALHIAAQAGYRAVVKLLNLSAAEANGGNRSGNTPLHLAAEDGHDIVVKLLLDNFDNIKEVNALNETALHLAAKGGHWAVTKLLLDYGASKSVKNSNGKTPLQISIIHKHKEVEALLVSFSG